MPEPTNKDGEGTEETTVPTADQFGVTLNQDGTEVSQEETIKKEGEDGGDDKGKKKEGEDGEEKSPEVVALEAKLGEYSKNLTGQNDVISKLQSQIADLVKGGGTKDGEEGKEGENVLFKDIKTSKDLTEEQKDDMSDTEIALYDANARQQEAMNKMFETINNQNKQTEEAKVTDLNTSANTEASKLAEETIKTNPELAKDAKELQDKIIVEFNEFNNEGISQEKLVERIKKALNNVSGYTAPKEQEKKGGTRNSPVKDGAGKGSDPFGVDAIVASVKKENKGEYSL